MPNAAIARLTHKSYVVSLPAAMLLILAVFSVGCSIQDENAQYDTLLTGPGWTISVAALNSSAWIINAVSSEAVDFKIGDDFSNARRYLEVMETDGVWNDSASSVNGKARTITYIVHFPIGWSQSNPYAIFSPSFGVVSADFVFPRSASPGLAYHIDFTDLGMDVHNSGFGDAKKYAFSQEDLFDTYFVFGQFREECTFLKGGIDVKVIFGGGKAIDKSACENIEAIFSYYTAEFGAPEQMSPSYEIGFFPARAYSSYHSGFYYPEVNYEFIAHELFHRWEPFTHCESETLAREGLASYMQVHAQYKTGILTLEERNALFEQKRALVSSLPRQFHSLTKEGLIELRKRNASAYSAIIYSRGGLVWELMEQEGIPPENSFREYLQKKNCSFLPTLMSTYNNLLLERVTQD